MIGESASGLCGNQIFAAVNLAQFRFFDLTGGIARNLSEDDFMRPLVPRKLMTESHDILLSLIHI